MTMVSESDERYPSTGGEERLTTMQRLIRRSVAWVCYAAIEVETMTINSDIHFMFEGKVYITSMQFFETNRYTLPDGRTVEATGWLESMPPQPEGVRLVLGEIGNPDELQKSRSQFRDMDLALRRNAIERVALFFRSEKQLQRLQAYLPYATDSEVQALDAITGKLPSA